jgi:hypothetical protein
MAVIYNLRDSAGDETTNNNDALGVYLNDWTAKPAVAALRAAIPTLLGDDMTPTESAQLAGLVDAVAKLAAVEQDNQLQLRGPGLKGWPQLGVNSAGDNRTLVDAFSAIMVALNVPGMQNVKL